MNLYEYSEKNNREMGILCEKRLSAFSDDRNIFKDTLEEIREIINGAELEKNSRETESRRFCFRNYQKRKRKEGRIVFRKLIKLSGTKNLK